MFPFNLMSLTLKDITLAKTHHLSNTRVYYRPGYYYPGY